MSNPAISRYSPQILGTTWCYRDTDHRHHFDFHADVVALEQRVIEIPPDPVLPIRLLSGKGLRYCVCDTPFQRTIFALHWGANLRGVSLSLRRTYVGELAE